MNKKKIHLVLGVCLKFLFQKRKKLIESFSLWPSSLISKKKKIGATRVLCFALFPASFRSNVLDLFSLTIRSVVHSLNLLLFLSPPGPKSSRQTSRRWEKAKREVPTSADSRATTISVVALRLVIFSQEPKHYCTHITLSLLATDKSPFRDYFFCPPDGLENFCFHYLLVTIGLFFHDNLASPYFFFSLFIFGRLLGRNFSFRIVNRSRRPTVFSRCILPPFFSLSLSKKKHVFLVGKRRFCRFPSSGVYIRSARSAS